MLMNKSINSIDSLESFELNLKTSAKKPQNKSSFYKFSKFNHSRSPEKKAKQSISQTRNKHTSFLLIQKLNSLSKTFRSSTSQLNSTERDTNIEDPDNLRVKDKLTTLNNKPNL